MTEDQEDLRPGDVEVVVLVAMIVHAELYYHLFLDNPGLSSIV